MQDTSSVTLLFTAKLVTEHFLRMHNNIVMESILILIDLVPLHSNSKILIVLIFL